MTSRWANITVAGPRAWELARGRRLRDGARAVGDAAHDAARQRARRACRCACCARASAASSATRSTCPPIRRRCAPRATVAARRRRCRRALYGIEALQVLRVEKGYMHIGTDTDGTTLPVDVGFARGYRAQGSAASSAAARCCGRPRAIRSACSWSGSCPSMSAPCCRSAGRSPRSRPRRLTEGHVTSSYLSPELGITRSRSRCSPAAVSGSENS